MWDLQRGFMLDPYGQTHIGPIWVPFTAHIPYIDLPVLDPYSSHIDLGERGGSVVECRTPEREVRGSRPTAAVLCP